MDFELLTKVVTSSVFGAIAGFFSPWIKYAYESRAIRRNDRRDRIAQWRRDLLDHNLYFDEKGQLRHSQESYRLVAALGSYSLLEPHLSPLAAESLKRFSKGRTIIVDSDDFTNPVRQIIAEEISRLEKNWRLL
ncbi:MAG TPA: hypothetical protein VFA57_04335 [Pseudolabrys sp.]|nr:hypothetical protein [Pseudolabrys sp.]